MIDPSTTTDAMRQTWGSMRDETASLKKAPSVPID